MPQQGLASFIVTYIEGRRQPKLEAFDKDAQKKLAAATEAEQGVLQQQLAQERRDLEQRYEVRAWLTDAAAPGKSVWLPMPPNTPTAMPKAAAYTARGRR